jgi:hypothetical protein
MDAKARTWLVVGRYGVGYRGGDDDAWDGAIDNYNKNK